MSTAARVFLDANVIFSAAKSAGAVRELLKRLRAAGHGLCVNAYVLAEAERNLATKFPESLSALASLAQDWDCSPTHLHRMTDLPTGLLPPKDEPVSAAAIQLGCTHLVTGDHTHFGGLYGTSVRLSPAGCAEALLG